MRVNYKLLITICSVFLILFLVYLYMNNTKLDCKADADCQCCDTIEPSLFYKDEKVIRSKYLFFGVCGLHEMQNAYCAQNVAACVENTCVAIPRE